MACLMDIGTGFVGRLLELTIVPIGRQVGYLVHYNKNVKELDNQLKDLVAVSQSVEGTIAAEKRNNKEPEAPVLEWLKRVKETTREANEILNEEQKRKMKCLCGLCPNLVLRHQLSRRSTKLVPDIVVLYEKKDFPTVAHDIIPQDVPTKDYEAFKSRTIVVNQIMDAFRNSPDVDRIGVYGFGGVGKTTLIKEVSRQATADKTLFNDVAMILDVKQNPSIQRIQKGIAERLGLQLPAENDSVVNARLLSTRVKDQKTLVILDDVWERIDLEAVGISGVSTCKVLLTSRSREVLSSKMHTQKEFVLDVLGEEESWSLFEKIAGDVIKVDPAIKTVATKVAKRCGGLPVLVATVASALKNRRTVHAWKDALTRLKKFDKEDFTEKTYLALEWSYNQLSGEELKSLFLLCGAYAICSNSKSILIEYLYKYGIGLGLFMNLNTLGEAWDALNSQLEKLKDSCLLLEPEDGTSGRVIKMHDLVHEVAKRILSRDQNVLTVRDEDEFREWPNSTDFCEKCTMILLHKSNIPKLPQVLQCTELELCLLNSCGTLEIPSDFFQETTKLSVLDLSNMSIPCLPPSLGFLKSLKTLCLDGCTLGDIALVGQLRNLEMLSFQGSKLKELPKEIGQLTRLRSLDLTDCSQLELIPPNVVSSFKSLEELKMRNSFNRWEAKANKGVASNTEKANASLSELKLLRKLSVLQIHVLHPSILPTDVFSDELERYQIYVGAAWKWDGENNKNLNTLKLKLADSNELDESGVKLLLKKTDELYLDGTDSGNNHILQLYSDGLQRLKHFHVHKVEFKHLINLKGIYPNLKRLVLSDLNGFRSLSSSMVRSFVQLTHLEISRCVTMEEIVSTNESDEVYVKDMFSKLEHLELKDLPILTRFCSRAHELESYHEIEETDSSSRENLHDAFFDQKVIFPSLNRLVINGLSKLMRIWHDQLPPECFKILETLEISTCWSLKSVFLFSTVRILQQLMHLKVFSCGVEHIVAKQEDAEQTETPHVQFVFTKVNSVMFSGLEYLKCFYPGMHVSRWPSLEDLRLKGCQRVTLLAREFNSNCDSMSPTPLFNQAFFLINQDSFPNLKRLYMLGMEIWDGLFPVNFFRKLETLQVSNPYAKSTSVLEKFLGHDELSFYEKGALHHLKALVLSYMQKLMNLGEDDSQLAGQNFPNLETLGVHSCTSLTSLRSSAISFTNLTNLNVTRCPRLQYFVSSSAAKSLTQLKYMTIVDCARLVEIVSNTKYDHDHDGSGNEIVFGRLEYVKLSKLPRLRHYSSGDCNVKFPSLMYLCMSKRLKLKIFNNIELQLTVEEVDTDVDASDEEIVIKERVDTDIDGGGEQIDEAAQVTIGNKDVTHDRSEHVHPLEITATDQAGFIAPMEVTSTLMVPVIKPSPVAEVQQSTEEVGEQAFSSESPEPLAEDTRLDVHHHQTPNAPGEQPIEDQGGLLEPSTATTGTPTPIIHALPLSIASSSQSSGVLKRSLRDKLEALSTKKAAANNSGLPEETKAKLKAIIDKADDLKDPHTRQHLLTVLPALQLQSTADLVVQELMMLPLILDKEKSLSQELATHKAHAFELDVRSQILLSQGTLAEENIQKEVQEKKVELLALEEQMKQIEARATSLRAEIANDENKYSGIEASLDELVEEQQRNQVSMDSTNQELLWTRAVSDSLCTAIFTYLQQLC